MLNSKTAKGTSHEADVIIDIGKILLAALA
jgi:hypothetical protein